MEFIDVVKKRRSIRAYKPDPVELEKISAILEAARQAPSWKNLQCWRFMVIGSREKREAITTAFSPQNPGAKALVQAPVIIVLCANPVESENWQNKDFYMLDAGLAMEHLVLAATDQGLATCWQGLYDEGKLREVLGVPGEFRIVALTPLGYPAQERDPRPRKAMEQIAFGEQWGEPWKG
ncbi:nitroreductase family protein [Desulfocucumis palustris]|uniref:Nitroreductase family protein n=1 Tax=Desulfocucumis palustris TaxID=1898651 RepID=A0A2L2XHN2_9FIRM|nr:nitroreductase family protein [Desulfocucumis palustris]GBF35213.1 nitroreductase family protein [Desulfocucumis palustris]